MSKKSSQYLNSLILIKKRMVSIKVKISITSMDVLQIISYNIYLPLVI